MGAINSRQKGASSERELATAIQDELGIKLVRVLDQSRDGGFDLDVHPDCTGPVAVALRRFAIESKRYAKITDSLKARFWRQAAKQAENAGRIPALAYRADRQGWRFVVPLAALQPGLGDNLDLTYTAELSIAGFALLVRESIAEGGHVAD